MFVHEAVQQSNWSQALALYCIATNHSHTTSQVSVVRQLAYIMYVGGPANTAQASALYSSMNVAR